MNTTGRLILLSCCAAAGVGIAICLGLTTSEPPANAQYEHLGQKAADRNQQLPPENANTETSTARSQPPTELEGSRYPEATGHQQIKASYYLVPPPSSTDLLSLDAAPSYGQEVVPPPSGIPLPAVLDLLKKGLDGKPSLSSPQEQTDAKERAAVAADGNGKFNIRVYDEDIRRVLELLSEQGNLNILASKSVEGKVSASLSGVDVEGALRAILKSTGYICRREGNCLYVGTPEEFNSLEQALDRIGTRTYRPNYVTAAELKALITPLLTERVGVVSVSSPAESGIGLNDSNAGGNNFSGSEVLVVRDYEAVLNQIDQLVAEVDVRPMQVAIEAMILSVKLQDKDDFGVNFQLLRDKSNLRFGLGSPPAALSQVKLDGGLKFGFLDTSLGAFLEALEQVGDTNVIANPRLMVLNKQRAEIQIGEKKGYISQTITETTSTQSVEFLDLGAQLRLRPFISSDGLIRLEVHPELSDGDVKVDPTGITLPNKELTQVTTNIMVRDGCTVVIGGLIREQLTTTTTQIPVLGNLPFIGFVFRQSKEAIERREVLVLITPRIVYEPGICQEGAQGACEFLRRQSTYADKMSIFGKRSIARRYYRLAENAYAAGQRHKALRFAEMAVHFDPLNRAALELRSDIWLNKPYEEHTAGGTLPLEPSSNPLEGEVLPDWLIEDLEGGSVVPAPPSHPLDPGVPGRRVDLVKPKVGE